jgi:4-amino-4-deoxy-L-arabinose transferase-like glycosyltransferase
VHGGRQYACAEDWVDAMSGLTTLNEDQPADGPKGKVIRRTNRDYYRGDSYIVAALFLAALIARLVYLGQTPNTVSADELDFGRNALDVVKGVGPGIFGLDWTPEPALSMYGIAGSFAAFGAGVFTLRLPAALITACAVIPLYSLQRRYICQAAALVTTFLFSTSSWFLTFSRSAWNNGEVITAMLLGMWALTRAMESGRKRYWILFGAAQALLLYGYFAGRTVVLAFALYIAGLAVVRARRDFRQCRKILLGALLAAGTALILFAPELPTVFSNLALFNNRVSATLVFNQPRAPGQTVADLVTQNARDTVRSYFLMDGGLGIGPYKGDFSWLDPVTTVLYLVGILLGLRRPGKTALWFVLFIVPLASTQLLSDLDGARGITAIAPMYFFAGLTIDLIMKLKLKRMPWRSYVMSVIVMLTSVFVARNNVTRYATWINSPDAQNSRAPAVRVQDYPLWRDFELSLIDTGQSYVNGGMFVQLSTSAILVQIHRDPAFLHARYVDTHRLPE